MLPDGTRVGSDGRMPWADLDVDVAEGAEVVLEAPEPEVPRGWRRPARLSRTPDERADDRPIGHSRYARACRIDQVTAGTPTRGRAEPEVAVEPEPDAARPSGTHDQLVEADPAVGSPGSPTVGVEPEPEGGSVERDDIDLLVEVDPAPTGRGGRVGCCCCWRAGAGARAPAGPDPAPPDDAVGLPPVARVPAPPPPRSGLIDSVPVAPAGRREPGAVGRRGAACAPRADPDRAAPGDRARAAARSGHRGPARRTT